MNLIVDANVLFSVLIKEGKSSEILLNFIFKFFTPEFIISEFKKHKSEILDKSYRSEYEIEALFDIVEEIIKIIPQEEFSDKIDEAKLICPDIDDIMYFALALKLNCPIWSNDKKLKEQNKVKVYSTEDLIKILEEH